MKVSEKDKNIKTQKSALRNNLWVEIQRWRWRSPHQAQMAGMARPTWLSLRKEWYFEI